MAEEQEQSQAQGNIRNEYNVARVGLNMDSSVNQVAKGMVTYALNAAVENFDSNSVNYQNEPANELCLNFPEGYHLIGTHFIQEKNKHIFFLANPETSSSEIGYMDNNDCVYNTYVNGPCLNFDINHPIHKVVHKITNCTTEIYWTDGVNPRRYLDLNPENLPKILRPGSTPCNPNYTDELDCNQIKLQPNFEIPQLAVVDVRTGGSLLAGTYQFAIQYSDAVGNAYTSYYSVTNPTPIANPQLTTPNFNYEVGRSIILNVSNLDVTGQFEYFNLAVIKTVNAITSVELVGTYFIDNTAKQVTYTGQNVTQIRLTVDDIFEKYPYYDIAQDVTAVQDILVWDNLTSIDRINYQQIANQVTLNWQTYKLPATENYADELNATNLRGYLRDEVYAFEIVFLLRNGKQTDGFHIPGRMAITSDLLPEIPTTNDDFIGDPTNPITNSSRYWQIYNTASVTGSATGDNIGNATPYQYGEFAYWESTELYPCNEDVWGELASKPIRHHKFPDALVSPVFESALFTSPSSMVMQNNSVFPMGVRIDVTQVSSLIQTSNLTAEQKADIAGFKIVRGDRGTNKSIIAKGILRNVGKYKREETEYYFPNYPYNDLRQDPFLLDKSNAFTANASLTDGSSGFCRNFTIVGLSTGTLDPESVVEYTDCFTNEITTLLVQQGETKTICALDLPVVTKGKACMSANTYKSYRLTVNAPGGGITNYDLIVNVITPNGLSCPNTNVPVGYTSFCDYCATNPTAPCCGTGSTSADGKFSEQSYTVSVTSTIIGSRSESVVINSIIPPIFVSWNSPFSGSYSIEEVPNSEVGYDLCNPSPLKGFDYEDVGYRLVFNSPETSFGQPFLGDVLKLEHVMFGAGRAHFVRVKEHAMYKLLSKEAQEDALASSLAIANITDPSDVSALFASYQAYLTIYVNGITRRNYAYSYNSIASYDYSADIANNFGIKQRELDIAQYIIPAVQSVGDPDGISINNWNRESSVYLKTKDSKFNRTIPPFLFPDKTPSLAPSGTSLVSDKSRYTISELGNCNNPGKESPINVVSYYASLKDIFVNQWGQIYSYETIDTGFQRDITPTTAPTIATIFGGDTFISRFAFKIKLPFFIDNRVGAPDDSDVFYDEIGNAAYPKYWYSARSVLSDITLATKDSSGGPAPTTLKNFISFKAHNLDCPNSQAQSTTSSIPNPGRTFYDGKMYLFAYGIPNFYCETSYNVNLRQAFNNREGDFWPHVSTGIPDDWVQESFVTIAQDNTYYYNVTFSKQNKENFFSHLPPDWEQRLCFTNYPFRAIYSDRQDANADIRVNNWLTYLAASKFDFPQNYGNLISLDGIQNRGILARFENKSLLYNNLLTINTSNPQAAYVGNPNMFSAPPIDFAETDLGYVGSQNKMLLKIPQGQITIDAKRGQVFLISGTQATDLSAFGSGLNRFFTDHLAFEILRYFPEVNTDNHFNGIGLHGVFDSKYDRVIISKLDYIPLSADIKYDADKKEFYIEKTQTSTPLRVVVEVTDVEYFCNKSWTLSFNFNTKSWVSFHSYIPNWYIAENNFFYSGLNGGCDLEAIAASEELT
jgi:hypothetical protein